VEKEEKEGAPGFDSVEETAGDGGLLKEEVNQPQQW